MELHVEKLKTIRKQKKISADELAAKAGISRVTLSAWENARRIPSEAKIRMLAAALNVPVNEISDLEPDKTISKINLTPLGTNIGSILNAEKEKDINRQKNLVSGIMGVMKELSNAKLIIGAMISSLPSIFYIKGSDLKYMTASEAFLKNLSLDKNFNVVGKTDYDFFPENEAKINAEMDKYVLASGESVQDKEGYIPGTRKTKWAIFSKIPIYDSEGNIEGLLGYFKDITVRKQAEETLKKSRLRLDFAHRAAGAGYWDWDITCQHLEWSRELFILFGLNPDEEEASFDTWRKVVHPDDYNKTYSLLEQSIKEKRFLANEYRIIRPDGQVRWISALGDIAYSPAGQPLSMTGICTDITERKLAVEALKQSNERMELALQAAGAAHWDWDITNQQLNWSKELYILFGLNPDKDEASFDTWKKIIHPDDYEKAQHRIQHSIKENVFHSNEYRVIHPDGKVHWICSLGKTSCSPSGKPLRMTGLCTDITGRKRAEEMLQSKTALLEAQKDASPDGILVVDANMKVTLFNKRFKDILNIPPHLLPVSKNIPYDVDDTALLNYVAGLTRYPEQFLKKIIYLYDHANETSRDEIEFKNGMILDRYSAPVLGEDGKYYGRIWTFCDITERKLAEEELKQSGQRLELAYQAAGAGYWDWDIPSQCLYWSRELYKLFGLDPDKDKPSFDTWKKVIHPDDRENAYSRTQRVIKEKLPFYNEYRVIHPDGQVYWVSSLGRITYSQSGQPLRVTGISIDITERKQMEEALRESESLFRESQLAAFIGSYKTDFTTGLWTSSEVLDQIFGIDKNYSRTVQGWLDIVHPDDREMMDRHLREDVFGKRQPFNKEYRIIRKSDGKTRWVSGLGKVTFDTKGNILLMLGTIQDITARKLTEEKIVNNSKLLQDMIDNSSSLIYMFDLEGRFISVNREVETLFGKSKDKIIGKKRESFLPAAIAAEHYLNDAEVIKTQKAISFEEENTQPDGKHFYFTTKFPLLDNQNKLYGLAGISTDITARKQAEAALLRSEEEYRTLAENSPDLIARFDKQLRHIYVNPAATAAGSRPSEEYIGKTMADLDIPESVRSIWDERIQKVFDTGELIDVIDSFPFADGLHYFHTRIVPEQDNDGSVLSVITFARDITERRQMEDQLQLASRQLKFHTENTPLAVVAFNDEYQITQWSDKAEEVFGWKADEVLGKRIQELRWVYEEDRKKVASLSTNMIKGNNTSTVNINRNYRKDGSVITCEWYNSALTDSNGKLISVYSLINDVTRRVQAEESLRESELFFKESQQAAFIGSYKLDFASGCWESSEVLDQILGIDRNYSKTIQGWLDIVHPDDRKTIDILFKEDVLTKHHPFNKEYRVIRKTDGEIRRVNDIGKVVFDAGGNAVSMTGTVQDITERKQPEENVKIKTSKKSMPE